MSGLSDAERFWSHVEKGPTADDCWIWTGAIADDGYGRFWTKDGDGQRVVRPHRFAHELATGVELPRSVLLLHSCDVPICVHAVTDRAETHLVEGTHRTNMLDRVQKHRYANRWSAWRFNGLARTERVRRIQVVVATMGFSGFDSSRCMAWAGVIPPSVLRGRLLSSVATSSSRSGE
jgi:hypothetical protein